MAKEWNPDWTIAPAAMLREWMDENPGNILTPGPATLLKADAARLVQEVLDREPLTQEHADLLEWGTAIRAQVWLNYERTYRADLAAGRKDTTEDGDDT